VKLTRPPASQSRSDVLGYLRFGTLPRFQATYYPSFLLQSESYATISFTIEDRDGAVLMPTVNVELGPESADVRFLHSCIMNSQYSLHKLSTKSTGADCFQAAAFLDALRRALKPRGQQSKKKILEPRHYLSHCVNRETLL